MFRNLVNTGATYSFEDIVNIIKSNELKEETLLVRELHLQKKEREKKAVKLGLPAPMFSGKFSNNRKEKDIEEYYQYVIVDVDGLTNEQVIEAKQKAIDIEYSLLVFVSPSGTGVKIIVKVDSPMKFHKKACEFVYDYYDCFLGFKVDRKNSDFSRMCFLCWDDKCYYNSTADVFEINPEDYKEIEEVVEENNSSSFSDDFIRRIESTIKFTENKAEFKKGNRHYFMILFATNCNGMGYELDDVIEYSKTRFELNDDYSIGEMTRDITNIYSSKKSEFGSREKSSKTTKNVSSSSKTLTVDELNSKMSKVSKCIMRYIADEDDVEFVTTFIKGVFAN